MSLFSSPPPELFTTTAPTVIDPADHPPLRGRGLRWVLLDELKRQVELYRWVGATGATERRIGILARRSRDWITAVRSQRTPPPSPQTWRERKHPGMPIPPWTVYGWLWNT